MALTEIQIQKQIVDWLRASGYECWRMSLGGVKRRGGVMAKNPLKGFPDLFGVLPGGKGVMYTIEVKTPEGSLSEAQKEWNKKLTKAGVKVIVASDLETVIKALKNECT